MRITYIAPSPIPSRAANTVHVMRMAQALASNGHEVVLIAPEYARKESLESGLDLFSFYGVQKNFSFYRTYALKIPKVGLVIHAIDALRKIRSIQTDLIFSRCLVTAFLAAKFKFPVIFEQHDAFEGRSDITKRLFANLIQNPHCKTIVVISNALKRKMILDFNVPENKIIVAHDGADPLDPTVQPTLPANGRYRAGYIGHLYAGRGIDIILKMVQATPDIDYHFVGGQPEDVEKWRRTSTLMSNVFFHGHVPPSATSGYMLSFDVLLAPYQHKVSVNSGRGDTAQWMSPLKIFEYMSSNKPIICSNLPVLQEVLENNHNSLLCTPDKPEEWVTAIKKLQSNQALAQTIAQQALKEFMNKFSWQARAAYIINFVEN